LKGGLEAVTAANTAANAGSKDEWGECTWWRRQAHLTDLEPCQISLGLMSQVTELHALCARRQSGGPARMAAGNAAAGKAAGKLRVSQCLFTEGRGSEESGRRHTLEVRLAPLRPKRVRADSFASGPSDARLVRRDEVVLLVGLPLRFPADGRVRVHCLQGSQRLPRAVLAPSTGPSTEDEAAPSAEGPLPGAVLDFSWLTPLVWPGRYTLRNFVEELMGRIEAEATLDTAHAGGLLPVPQYKLQTARADAALAQNEAAASEEQASRLARIQAPLTPEAQKAQFYALLGAALQVACLLVLLALKRLEI